MRDDGRGAVAARDDRAGILDIDFAGIIAHAAGAADRHRELYRIGFGCERAGCGKAAVAAAAADALREDAVGMIAGRGQQLGVGDIDFIGLAAGAALAADRDAEIPGVGLIAERSREAEAAVTAAAADALGDDRRSRIGKRFDDAVVGDLDLAAIAAAAAAAADRHGELRAVATETACQAAGETTGTAAAADALRDDAVRCGLLRGDLSVVEDIDKAGIGAADALAAQREVHAAAAIRQAARDGEPAVTAAATDALC